MIFTIDRSIEVLEQTPKTIAQFANRLSSFWTSNNEGGETWSVFDVVGHLLHGEKTDWMVRVKIILSDNPEKSFEPFDRFAQFETSKNKTLNQLLEEFESIRKVNIMQLKSLNITENDLLKTGIHPMFGVVTLQQLIATWVVHDLDHISQISRVMAKQYKEETGPWIEFLKILKQ